MLALFSPGGIEERGVDRAARKHVANFVIDGAESLKGLRLCNICDEAEMREYGGKRRHRVAWLPVPLRPKACQVSRI